MKQAPSWLSQYLIQDCSDIFTLAQDPWGCSTVHSAEVQKLGLWHLKRLFPKRLFLLGIEEGESVLYILNLKFKIIQNFHFDIKGRAWEKCCFEEQN